jgi:hypothetical protein
MKITSSLIVPGRVGNKQANLPQNNNAPENGGIEFSFFDSITSLNR